MPWECTYSADTQTVELRYAGSVTPGDLEASANASLDLCRTHSTNRIFTDCTAMTGGHSVIDLYGLAKKVQEATSGQFREAVLPPAGRDPQDRVGFWETTSRNRGLDVRMVGSRDEGIAWLVSVPASWKDAPERLTPPAAPGRKRT